MNENFESAGESTFTKESSTYLAVPTYMYKNADKPLHNTKDSGFWEAVGNTINLFICHQSY